MARHGCRFTFTLGCLCFIVFFTAPLAWQTTFPRAAAMTLPAESAVLDDVSGQPAATTTPMATSQPKLSTPVSSHPPVVSPPTSVLPMPVKVSTYSIPTDAPELPVSTEHLVYLPLSARETQALIDRRRFFYEPDFNAHQIQAFLDTQPGPLKAYVTTVANRQHSFAELLGSQTALYSLNPKVVLALIELQSGLVTPKSPSEEQRKSMPGFEGVDWSRAGWLEQLHWTIYELHSAQRDFPTAKELLFANRQRMPLPPWADVGDYALMRVLAATISKPSPADFERKTQAFVATYQRLFDDPRQPPQDWPAPAAPFLTQPMDAPREVTSFFDHDTPFLTTNGAIVTYRGDREPELSYDGHDGWDFALDPYEPVRAAAAGTVVFAGYSDDGCGVAGAVIIDHHNGYRTLYWHLAEVTVAPGPVEAGDQLGLNGNTGCSSGYHLHFQVQYLGRDTDPAGWCGPADGDPWARHPAGQVSTWLWRDWPSPCHVPGHALAVGVDAPGFRRHGEGWEDVTGGMNGSALRVRDAWREQGHIPRAVWRPPIAYPGKYRVLAWVPYVMNNDYAASQVFYEVGHLDKKDRTQRVEVSQRQLANGWADLGVHFFEPQHRPFVGLAANKYDWGSQVVFDTVVWLPVDVQPPAAEDMNLCLPESCPSSR